MSTPNSFFNIKQFSTGALVAGTATQVDISSGVFKPNLDGNLGAQGYGNRHARSLKVDIVGTVTGPVFLKFGGPGMAPATNADMPMTQEPGGTVIQLPMDCTWISVLSAADTPTVYLSVGSGND